MHRTLDDWMLVHARASQRLHRHEPRRYNVPFSFMTCSLEKLGLVYQNRLEHDWFALVLRALLVGRRQQSESTNVASVME